MTIFVSQCQCQCQSGSCQENKIQFKFIEKIHAGSNFLVQVKFMVKFRKDVVLNLNDIDDGGDLLKYHNNM